MLPPSSSPLESSAVLSQEEFDARRQYFLDSAEFTIDVPRFPEHDGGKDVSFEIWRNPSTDRLEVIGAVRVESPGFPLNL